MSDAFKCDRCGDYSTKEPDTTLRERGLDPARDRVDEHTHELCGSCSPDFFNFLRGCDVV